MGNECRCTANKDSKQQQICHSQPEPEPIPTPDTDRKQETATDLDPGSETIVLPPKEKSTHKTLEEPPKLQKAVSSGVERRGGRVQFILPRDENVQQKDTVRFLQQPIEKTHIPLIIKTLKKHFILSQLNDKEISYVVKKMKLCTSNKNSYIFKQSDPSFSYYVILEGDCRVEINGKPKKRLVSGDSFGDLGIIYSAPRSASIFSQDECLMAELNRTTFRKIISDLNSMQETECKKALQNLEFYNCLNEAQKNVLATDCITEIYESGEIIFNKGDDANAFYIVLEGIVTLLEKKIDFKVGENVGTNAIIQNEKALRSSTLIAKTRCKLISITKARITEALGDTIGNIIQKNLIQKIIFESDISELVSKAEWESIIEQMTMRKLNKGDVVFKEGENVDLGSIYVLLSIDLKSKSGKKTYIANAIVEEMKIFKREKLVFSEDYIADGEGYIGIGKVPEKKAESIKKAIDSEKKQIDDLKLEDFIVLRKLRAGNFGQLYSCYNKETQKKYAVKVMNKVKLARQSVMSYVFKEEEILKELPLHPFIIQLYKMFVDTNYVILILQLYEGQDLFDAFSGSLNLTGPQIRLYMSQILLMIEHLHKNKVIYRDLKPENLMLDEKGNLNLVDFGTAKKLKIEHRYKTMTIIGTPHYMAPEIITGKGYSLAADWWSMGILLYEMISGKLPFGEFADDPFAIYEEILKQEIIFPRYVDIGTRELVERLLKKLPQQRWGDGFEQLKKMQYFAKVNWAHILSRKQTSAYTPSKSCQLTETQIRKAMKKKNNSLVTHLEKSLKDLGRSGKQ